MAVRDGMEALMILARDEQIGWEMNCGWRCDVDFEIASVIACCNKRRFEPNNEDNFFEIQAQTPQGALAGAILAVLQDRARRASAVPATV